MKTLSPIPNSQPASEERRLDDNIIGEGKEHFGWRLPPKFLWCDGSAYSSRLSGGYSELAREIGKGEVVGAFSDIEAFSVQWSLGLTTLTTSFPHTLVVGDIMFMSGASSFTGGWTSAVGFSDFAHAPLIVLTTPTDRTLTVTSPLNSAFPGAITAIGSSGSSWSTTFNVPDCRDRVGVGRGNMGGTDAAVIGTENTIHLNHQFGEDAHLLTGQESGVQNHTHPYVDRYDQGTDADGNGGKARNNDIVTDNRTTSGSGNIDAVEAHNNLQPSYICNKIIRYLR